jgi:hypothetical protein
MPNPISASPSGLTPIQHTPALASVQSAAAPSGAVAPKAPGALSSSDGNSTLNQLLTKLEGLEASDPKTATETLNSLSSQLHQLAVQAGEDSRQGKQLQGMATDFSAAAQNGDIAGLEAKVHHHSRQTQGGEASGGGLGAYQQWQQADTNAGVQSILSQALQSLD